MRPFTKAVFEREGKLVVGSRWTLEQVQQAYEKADKLLDYVSEYKAFEHVKELGLDKVHTGFKDGLKFHLAKDLPNKALQSLSLLFFRQLLDQGRDVMRFAAWAYKNKSDTFKGYYASSKAAFLKDKFLLRDVPVYSFSPFDTGDNPAIIQDEKLSQICAKMYHDSQSESYPKGQTIPGYIFWMRSSAGDRLFNEMVWLRKVSYEVDPKRIDHSIPLIASQMQHTNE
ncbi:MAG: hypothetical protein IKS41_05305 [Alphaproteobacteria bacterium]|nr:hypothetical protein [Alphaproteobacteria bacterium]